MLSVEIPPDPSCLPHQHQSDDDQSASRKLAFKKIHHDYDDQHQLLLSTFSIRDYVYTARHNHIEKNWPFSQKHLQLCFKHEIKDLLPPFEPPDLVRKQCFRKSRRLLLSHTSKPVAKVASLGEEWYLHSLQPQEKSPSSPGLNQAVETQVTKDRQSERLSPLGGGGLPCSLQEDSSTLSQSAVDLQNSQLQFASRKNESIVESSRRKCRLIVKLSPISDAPHTEDITLNPIALSDAMASKVCPVCKTFSSTSNTTLNAHIDQCLAVEPTSKWVTIDNTFSKLMVKPMKKRSMVDIYATAPRCTLEELDRRNGSNWAADSSLLMEKAKTTANEKKQRPSGENFEGTSDENPVYFDSNGTKLRIISKFSNTSLSTAEDGPRKLVKTGKEESKLTSYDGKKHFRKTAICRNPDPQNKRLCSLESNNDKISGVRKINGMQKVCDKQDSLSQFLKARDRNNRSESGILTKWVCSKRTGLLKRVTGKQNRYDLGCSSLTMNSSTERNKMHLGDSSLGGSSILPNPTLNAVSLRNTLYADSPIYETQPTDCGVDSLTVPEIKHYQSTNGSVSSQRSPCLLKLPNSSGTFAPSPRSKRIEVNANSAENTDTLAKGNESILSNELVNPSFFNLKSKLTGKRSVPKKPRMHRSIAEMDEQVGANSYDVDERCNYVHHFEENVPGRYQIGVAHNLNGSNDKVRPEAQDISDHLSVGSVSVLASRRGREASTLTTEEASPTGSEDPDLDVDAKIESHIGAPLRKFYSSNNIINNIDCLETGAEVNEDTVIKTFSRNDVGVPFSKSSNDLALESRNLRNSLDARHSSLRCTDEHKRCECGTETLIPLVQQNLRDSQATCRASEVHTIWEDADMATEVNSQCRRCRTDRPSVPALPGSVLPILWDMNSEDLQEHSSLSSSRIPFAQDRHVVADRGLSESPVSTTSTIVHPTIVRSEAKFLNPESCSKSSEVQDRLTLDFSGGLTGHVVGDAISLPFMVSAEGTRKMNLDGKSPRDTPISLTEDSVKYTDDQPCCCFWKTSFSLDDAQDQFIEERTRALSTMPVKGKWMRCNTSIGPEIFGKPDSSSLSRNSDMVEPICESPRVSVSRQSSPDDVKRFTRHDDFSRGNACAQVQDVQYTSNPILRLMGKNLMVVNNDNDRIDELRQPPLLSSNTCASTKYENLLEFSPGSTSSHFMLPEGSVASSQDSCNAEPHFLSDLPKGFKSHSCSWAYQRQEMVGKVNMQVADSSLMWHGLKSRANLQIQQKKHINKLDSSFAYNVERVHGSTHFQHVNPGSSVQMIGNSTQEIIVIDDSPESEAELSFRRAKYGVGLEGSQQSLVGGLPPTYTHRSAPQMSAVSYLIPPNTFPGMVPLVGTKPHLLGSSPVEANIAPARWGGPSKDSGVTLWNPFTSTCHMNQSVHHSPSFP